MANEFNPQANETNPPSFLNYSRGVEDNTYRSLFRGIADTVDSGLKAVDRGFTQQVKDEVRASVENTDLENYAIDANPKALPPEVSKSMSRLKASKEAMLNGRMPESHYYAKLHSEAKKIRSRWGGADGASGYTEQIDNAFQELIGTTPANALRRQAWAEMDAAKAAAAKSQSDRENFAEAIIKSGSVPPEFVDTIALPGMVQNDEYFYKLKSGVARRESERNLIEISNLRIENEKKRGEINKDRAASDYTKQAAIVVDDIVRRGATYERLQTATRQVEEERLSGKTADPRKLSEIRALQARLESQVEEQLVKLRLNFPGSEAIRDKIPEIENLIRDPVKRIGQGLANEDFGVLKSATLHLKTMRESSTADLLANSQKARAIDAIGNVFGDTGRAWVIQQEGYESTLSPASDFFTQAAKADVATGSATTLSQTIDDLKANLSKDPEAAGDVGKSINKVMSDLPSAVRDDRIPEEMRYNIAKKVYNSNNKDFWARLTNPEIRSRIYNDMLNPENFKAIQKLAMKDPQLLQDYETTLVDFGQVVAREPISTLNGIASSVSDRVVKYDAATNRIKVEEVAAPNIQGRRKEGDPISSFTQRAFNRVNSSGVESATIQINNVLKSFEPIWAAQGIPKDRWGAEALATLKMYGIQLDKSGENFYERLRGTEPRGGRMNLSQDVPTPGRNGTQVNAETGTDIELRDTIKAFNEETDPERQQALKEQILDLMLLDPNLMDRKVPFRNPQNVPTSQEEETIIMSPSQLGGPINPSAPAIKNATEIVDLLTGAPSFIEAIKSGDPATIAAAAAGIIPFPGAKIGKASTKALEEVYKIIADYPTVANNATKLAKQAREFNEGQYKLLEKAVADNKYQKEDLEDLRKIAYLGDSYTTKLAEWSSEYLQNNVSRLEKAALSQSPDLDKIEKLKEGALKQTQYASEATTKLQEGLDAFERLKKKYLTIKEVE